MKNKILFFSLLALPSIAFTQIQKGTGYFEGQINVYYNNGENLGSSNTYSSSSTSNSWNFNISYGHYLTDVFAIGLGAGIYKNDFKNENTGVNYSSSNKQTSTFYYVDPFIRTSNKIVDNFYFFGKLNLSAGTGPTHYTYSSSNSESQITDGTQSFLGAGLTGGLNYFLNRHFALSLSYGNISYFSSTTKNVDESGESEKITSDVFNVNLGLSSLAIGLQYFINNTSEKK